MLFRSFVPTTELTGHVAALCGGTTGQSPASESDTHAPSSTSSSTVTFAVAPRFGAFASSLRKLLSSHVLKAAHRIIPDKIDSRNLNLLQAKKRRLPVSKASRRARVKDVLDLIPDELQDPGRSRFNGHCRFVG
mgnify:FL=1